MGDTRNANTGRERSLSSYEVNFFLFFLNFSSNTSPGERLSSVNTSVSDDQITKISNQSFRERVLAERTAMGEMRPCANAFLFQPGAAPFSVHFVFFRGSARANSCALGFMREVPHHQGRPSLACKLFHPVARLAR